MYYLQFKNSKDMWEFIDGVDHGNGDSETCIATFSDLAEQEIIAAESLFGAYQVDTDELIEESEYDDLMEDRDFPY